MSSKRKPLTEITDLDPREVSLVNRGANLKKRFPIWKQEQQMETQEILKAVADTELDEEKELVEWFEKAAVSEKGMNAVKAALRILSGFKDELPTDVMDKLASVAGYPAPAKKAEGEIPPKKKEDEMSKGEVKKELEGMPEEIQKQFEDIQKAHKVEIDALKQTNEDIKKALDDERDKRELAEWTQKAETDLSHYPGQSSEEIAKSLQKMHAIDPKLAEGQFKNMKEASDALKQSAILKAAGSRGEPKEGSAEGRLEKAAAEIRKADPKLSEAQSIAKALDEDPKLYDGYLDENEEQTK